MLPISGVSATCSSELPGFVHALVYLDGCYKNFFAVFSLLQAGKSSLKYPRSMILRNVRDGGIKCVAIKELHFRLQKSN